MKKRAQLMAVCLAFAVLFSSSTLVFAAPGKAMSAEIVVSGYNGSEKSSVLLNGEPVSSGRTFYTSGSVSTDSASATINLGKLGRITMLPGSKMSLNFTENSISADLSAGSIEVLNNAGVSVNVRTADNMVSNDAAEAGSFSVDVTSGTTNAFASSGKAFTKDGAVADDDDNKKHKKRGGAFWLPVIFGAAVATAVILVVTTTGGDDVTVVSPVR